MKNIILIMFLAGSIFAQEVVELKLPNSNKFVIKFLCHYEGVPRFRDDCRNLLPLDKSALIL